MRFPRSARALGLLAVTALSVAGMAPTKGGPPPPPIDANPNDEAVVVVVRDLDRHGQSLTETERACLDGVLREQPTVEEALRRTGDVERLEVVDQDVVFSAASTCAPAAIGRALHTTFLNVSGMTSRSAATVQYECLGSSGGTPLTTMMLHHSRRVPTSDGMEILARLLYMCSKPYFAEGPFAQSLDVKPAVAACVADYVANIKPELIPEVSRILWGQGDRRQSKTLRVSIKSCRMSTKPMGRSST